MKRTTRASQVAKACFAGLGLTAAFAAGAHPALAAPEKVTVSSQLERSSAVPALRIVDGKAHLRLDEAVAMALEKNLSIQVQRFDRASSRLGIDKALGIYDFSLTSGFQASSDTTPAASNLDGAQVQKSDRLGFQLGLSRVVPSGGLAEVSWSNSRLETNSRFALLNPSFNAGLDFIFSQPLLRDFGKQNTERAIIIARNGDEVSRLGFAQQVTDVVRDVETAYWNVIEARYQLEVAQASLDLAKQLHAQNRVRVDVGTLAPLELVQSEVGIATREEEIIRAQLGVGDAEDRLRQLLGLDQGDSWLVEIVPETDPQTAVPEIRIDDAIAGAMRERPEVAAKRLSRQVFEVDAAYYRNQTLPRLDLRAVYGFNGVGGDAILTDADGNPVGTLPGGWGDSLQQVVDANYRGWSVGVQFAYPLANRAAKAQSAQANLALARTDAELKDLELAVSTEVRRTARAVEAAAKAIESAKASRRLAEKNLEAEQKKYENGLSTSFQVLQIQDELTSARSRLATAVTGFRKALVIFHRATGQLLTESGVEVTGESASAR